MLLCPERKSSILLLDPNVTIVSRQSQEEWNSRYVIIRDELAAFYQQQCARISKERCVNVGYPGKFFAKKRIQCSLVQKKR